MEAVKRGEVVIPTPRWFIGLRIAQIVISLIIVALAGFFIHGYYTDALGVAIASVCEPLTYHSLREARGEGSRVQ